MMGHRVKHKKSQKSLEAALANPMMDGSDMSHNPYPTASTTIDFSRMGAKKSARQSLSPENAMDGRSRTKPENKTHRGYLHQERSHPYHQQPQPQVQPQTRQQLHQHNKLIDNRRDKPTIIRTQELKSITDRITSV